MSTRDGEPDWVLRILAGFFLLCILAVAVGLIGQLITRHHITTW